MDPAGSVSIGRYIFGNSPDIKIWKLLKTVDNLRYLQYTVARYKPSTEKQLKEVEKRIDWYFAK